MSLFKWFQSIGLLPQRPDCCSHVTAEGMDAWNKQEEVGLANPKHLGTTSEAHPGYVGTVSGRLFDVMNPRPEEVDIDEMAHALAQINRFCGHTKYPYSVAQHSCYCAEECERRYPGQAMVALACLLHDGAEAYCGDVIRPIKRMIGPLYRPIEDRVQRAIWSAFHVNQSSCIDGIVKEIDNATVMVESRELMIGSEEWNWEGVTPSSVRIRRWHPAVARLAFLTRFRRLYEEAHGFSYIPGCWPVANRSIPHAEARRRTVKPVPSISA
jgi:hypothetical protein